MTVNSDNIKSHIMDEHIHSYTLSHTAGGDVHKHSEKITYTAKILGR